MRIVIDQVLLAWAVGRDGSGSTISTKLAGNIPQAFPVEPFIHSALTQLSNVITSPAYIGSVNQS